MCHVKSESGPVVMLADTMILGHLRDQKSLHFGEVTSILRSQSGVNFFNMWSQFVKDAFCATNQQALHIWT